MAMARYGWLLVFVCGAAEAAELASLASPDGSNAIAVQLDEAGALSYTVSRKGREVLGESPLGLKLADQDFTKGLKLTASGEQEKQQERYELFAGLKPQVDQPHHRRSLSFANASGAQITLDLDAGNEGVAFRYRIEAEAPEATVEEELSGFHLPAEAKGWISPYNASSSSSPAYEDYYFAVKPGDPPPYSRGGNTRGWYFPALFQTPAAWVLLSESGTDANYCACHLAADSSKGVYRIAFPFEDEGTKRVQHAPGTKPHHALPWTMPWRVIAMGDKAGDILTSTLVTDLAPESKLADVSWIKPGRVSWSWWAYPNGQNGTELYSSYISAAAKMGWEYSLLDAGWQKADTKALATQAAQEKVGLLVWAHADSFYDADRRTRRLDEYAQLGIKGVKIDFWCTDRQDAMAAMSETLREAAARKLMVNFHGCSLPRGWQRTWPNFMAAEAVLGEESYMFDERYPEKVAELNTILPFTRNVAGPMDYTPLGLGEKRYKRKTTAAHELATALIFTSGITHYADKPETYAAFPEAAIGILRDAPARWDETRCLIGEPGKVVVVARREKENWFIAGINGTGDVLPVEIDLSNFPTRKWQLVREGGDALNELKAEEIQAKGSWKHEMPARGGFVLRGSP
ncbi:glycoside hydrolase family 97 protein [Haloferula sp. BvORR071]|uniref:glycoside hydrolase family 97 protein n=1 Tax=Haloferula sp. BvORR071 TaxID=1396141 RepID=UPI000558AC54|nr:glycoside hydrolase family 97 protein [Haloferula sp. BvORR071]